MPLASDTGSRSLSPSDHGPGCGLPHPGHVIQAGLLGADVCTLPAKVFDQMLKHPLTDRGVEQFLKDWEKVPVIK